MILTIITRLLVKMMSEIDETVLRERLKVAEAFAKAKKESKILDWVPYDKQWDYLNCDSRYKALTAANQVGKTTSGMFEEAAHLTGIYHKDWRGKRYDRPVDIWIVGETSARVRDTLQEKLFGPIGQWGTGFIPKDCIDMDKMIKNGNPPGCINKAWIKHSSGGYSTVQFFSFDQGRESFQGSTIDRVYFDEQAPQAIVNECKIRLLVKRGTMVFTFTPVINDDPVYEWIMESKLVKKFAISMDDCPFLTEEMIEEILDGFPEDERMARRTGVAMKGSRIIYKAKPEDYTCESFELPKHWPRLFGFDLGLNHPTAVVAAAWDRDADCIYIYNEYCVSNRTPPEHRLALMGWGQDIPYAMSHDAYNRSSQTGKSTAELYEELGMKNFNAGKDRWARIEEVRSRMSTGRLYIFKDKCPQLLKEMKTYQTKEDGRTIIRVKDDTIAAFEHAVAHIDKAVVPGAKKPPIEFTIKEYVPFDKRLGI